MHVYRNYQTVSQQSATSLTIGNFDGVHLGHQALLARVTEAATAGGFTPAGLTFSPHPARFIAPQLAPALICSTEDKHLLLKKSGLQVLLDQTFNQSFSRLTPEDFVQEVLIKALNVRHLVVGHDFTFGARRGGNLETLKTLGAKHGFTVERVEAVTVGSGLVASSSKVREFVLEGRMEGAALVLGRAFHLSGVIIEGRKRGRLLGFPTANLAPESELSPKPGVYSTWLDWGEGPRAALTNVGYNPTFGPAGQRTVETHVLDRTGLDIYGVRCRLFFERRLRDERRFDSPEALVTQIEADCAQARVSFGEPPRALSATGDA